MGIRQHGARKLIFVDLNLIAHRGYALALFTALIPLRHQWYGLATVLLADDPELLESAGRSGCRGLLMGLESISETNLRQNHKGFNSPADYARVVARLHEHGIALQGCFVFGLDDDQPDVFMKTAEFAVEAGIDLPRFAVVTPFPSTPLYNRLESEGSGKGTIADVVHFHRQVIIPGHQLDRQPLHHPRRIAGRLVARTGRGGPLGRCWPCSTL